MYIYYVFRAIVAASSICPFGLRSLAKPEEALQNDASNIFVVTCVLLLSLRREDRDPVFCIPGPCSAGIYFMSSLVSTRKMALVGPWKEVVGSMYR